MIKGMKNALRDIEQELYEEVKAAADENPEQFLIIAKAIKAAADENLEIFQNIMDYIYSSCGLETDNTKEYYQQKLISDLDENPESVRKVFSIIKDMNEKLKKLKN